MKIVLIGAKGKLGGALAREWIGKHEVKALTRADIDLRETDELGHLLDETEFDALVNCAALASPDACLDDVEAARLVNEEAPQVMARACREHGARLLHFSTDYVLDGHEEGLKDETAATYANGEYGRSKRAGEEAVLEEMESGVVGRVSWVFGTEPGGFCETIVQRAKRGEELEAISDKFSMPTYARDIAKWSELLLSREEAQGIYHLTHTGDPQSWWSYGSQVLEDAFDLGLLEKPAKISSTKMAELNIFRAPRPIHTAMTPRRLQEELGVAVRDWRSAARDCLASLAKAESH